MQLFNCIESSADLCLPTQGHRLRHGPLSGWNRSAHTLKQSAQFWHKVWSDCGCPTSGVLLQIKKNSKRRFKYEVRRLRRRQNHIQRENLATALSHRSPQEFWKQVKKLSKSSSGTMSSSSVVDGSNNDIEISNISHLSSSHFSTLTLIHNPEPIFNTVLRNLLTPLPSLLFLSPRRPFVMLSLNLNTARMMAQSSPPITSSMLKMFSVFLFLSCSLLLFDTVLSQLLSVIVSLFPYPSLVRIHPAQTTTAP